MRITVIPIVQGCMRIKWVIRRNTVSFKLVFIFFNWVSTGFQAHKFLWASALGSRGHWGSPGMHSPISFSAHSGFRPYFIPLVSLPVASTFQNCDFSFQNCDFSLQTLKTRTPILRFPKERNVPKQRAQLPAVYPHKPGTRGKKESYLFS